MQRKTKAIQKEAKIKRGSKTKPALKKCKKMMGNCQESVGVEVAHMIAPQSDEIVDDQVSSNASQLQKNEKTVQETKIKDKRAFAPANSRSQKQIGEALCKKLSSALQIFTFKDPKSQEVKLIKVLQSKELNSKHKYVFVNALINRTPKLKYLSSWLKNRLDEMKHKKQKKIKNPKTQQSENAANIYKKYIKELQLFQGIQRDFELFSQKTDEVQFKYIQDSLNKLFSYKEGSLEKTKNGTRSNQQRKKSMFPLIWTKLIDFENDQDDLDIDRKQSQLHQTYNHDCPVVNISGVPILEANQLYYGREEHSNQYIDFGSQ